MTIGKTWQLWQICHKQYKNSFLCTLRSLGLSTRKLSCKSMTLRKGWYLDFFSRQFTSSIICSVPHCIVTCSFILQYNSSYLSYCSLVIIVLYTIVLPFIFISIVTNCPSNPLSCTCIRPIPCYPETSVSASYLQVSLTVFLLVSHSHNKSCLLLSLTLLLLHKHLSIFLLIFISLPDPTQQPVIYCLYMASNKD